MYKQFIYPSVKLMQFQKNDVITTSGLLDGILGSGTSGDNAPIGNKTQGNDFINVGGDLTDSTD